MTTLFYFKTISDYWDPPEITYYKVYIDDNCSKNSCKLAHFVDAQHRITVGHSNSLYTKTDIRNILKNKKVTIISEEEWKENASKMLEIAKNLI